MPDWKSYVCGMLWTIPAFFLGKVVKAIWIAKELKKLHEDCFGGEAPKR